MPPSRTTRWCAARNLRCSSPSCIAKHSITATVPRAQFAGWTSSLRRVHLRERASVKPFVKECVSAAMNAVVGGAESDVDLLCGSQSECFGRCFSAGFAVAACHNSPSNGDGFESHLLLHLDQPNLVQFIICSSRSVAESCRDPRARARRVVSL
mmetsp:Transcript_5693/g.18181  ORF Transcript_5693/g.18181 Transcript_5693/m.18181 type:complete len:154 (+) Transcript_5693:1546-2007(+)